MKYYNPVMCQELDAGWDLMGNGANSVVIAKIDERLRADCSRSRGEACQRGIRHTNPTEMQWI